MILALLLFITLVISVGIVAILILYIIKLINKNTKNIGLEKSIREGIKSAIEEIEYKKERETEFSKESKRVNRNLGVYISTNDSGPVESDGDLIPFNATEEEKEILRMFYHN
jgi:hypothetical protein